VSEAPSRRYNTAPNSGPEGAQPIAAEGAPNSPARDTLETTFVVDVDVHLHESPTEMAAYASDPCCATYTVTTPTTPSIDLKLSRIHTGEVITWPWHSLEFHEHTGQCIALPSIKLRRFKVRATDAGTRIVV
jgi:nitrite reductase/ring-hydroxylating ferredoxin subunit